MIANTNSASSVATANLNTPNSVKSASVARASQSDVTPADDAAEVALLAGTDYSAAQNSNLAGFIPDAAAAAHGSAFARQNMLSQPGAAMLAQANLSAESVLKLLT